MAKKDLKQMARAAFSAPAQELAPAEQVATEKSTGTASPMAGTARKIGRPRTTPAGTTRKTSLTLDSEKAAKMDYIAERTGASSRKVYEAAMQLLINSYEEKHGVITIATATAQSLEELL